MIILPKFFKFSMDIQLVDGPGGHKVIEERWEVNCEKLGEDLNFKIQLKGFV